MREILKQPAHAPLPLAEQVLLLLVASDAALVEIDVDDIREFEAQFRAVARERLGDLLSRLDEGAEIGDDDTAAVASLTAEVKDRFLRRKMQGAAEAEPTETETAADRD